SASRRIVTICSSVNRASSWLPPWPEGAILSSFSWSAHRQAGQNSQDERGSTHYGTAGYLGDGYFITVRHAVVRLDDPNGEPRPEAGRGIATISVRYNGQDVPAHLIDTGNAREEVHTGDWAIIRTRPLPLPPVHLKIAFAYDFAEPIFRLGNDYSKGIIVSTGYVGQRMPNGLVSALTDGHPGVSGGGVLDRHGDLVGIPVGRMQGDFRFAFILPLRPEMFRRVPAVRPSL
ncbi:MAG: trypsin-like peptidase domain-containing protein, partial [Acidimicrobiia bacterium]|nr:trypsin-like peptidase domain-containing protein [Acidimicrobiia bacterium]